MCPWQKHFYMQMKKRKNRFVFTTVSIFISSKSFNTYKQPVQNSRLLFSFTSCFFSQHTTCIMITTIINITHPLRYIQTKHIFFCVIQNKCTHILIFSSVFLYHCSPKKIKKKSCCYLQISKQESKHSPHQGCFFSFFSPHRLNSADVCSLINIDFLVLVYLHVALIGARAETDLLWQMVWNSDRKLASGDIRRKAGLSSCSHWLLCSYLPRSSIVNHTCSCSAVVSKAGMTFYVM